MKRLLVGIVVLVIWVTTVAASAASQSSALAIAGVIGVILPFILKLVPAAGHYMIAITLVASLLVAVLAELVSGELVLSSLQKTDPVALFTLFMSVWGLSQVVYAILIQSPKTAGAVT